MKQYKTYLFDADGTLFDTADLVVHCFKYVAKKHCSRDLSREAILTGYGLPLKGQLIEHLGQDVDIDLILDDFISYQVGILDENVSLFPGVFETLAALKDQGRKLAIVTSRKRYTTGRILELTGTRQFFDTVVNPEDTTRHKPEAEPALLALSRLGADAGESLFVGDSQFDIGCGHEAEMETAFVSWSHQDVHELPVQPTWKIDRMQDLLSGNSA
jgi:pyrophosphatase PpaX